MNERKKFRLLNNSGLGKGVAEYMGLYNGSVLTYTGHKHSITHQMLFVHPRGVVALDDENVIEIQIDDESVVEIHDHALVLPGEEI